MLDEVCLMSINEVMDVTDSKDRIYGLLSLMPDLDILPRYERSVEEAYQDAAFAIFSQRQTTDLLLANRYDMKRQTSLPSWTPDWRQGGLIFEQYSRWTLDGLTSPYRASAGQAAVVKRFHDRMRIKSRRLFVIDDSCILLSPFTYNYSSAEAARDHFLKQAIRLRQSVRKAYELGLFHSYDSIGSLEHAFIRTLTLDQMTEEKSDQTPTLGIPAGFLHFLREVFKVIDTKKFPESFYSMYKGFALENRTGLVYQKVLGSRILGNPNGQLCMVPACSRIGDQVHILSGCSVPIALRPVETDRGRAFQVLGGAYVHGVMDGEAVFDSPKRVSTGDPDAYDMAFEEEICLI